jgi:hypothetical protein
LNALLPDTAMPPITSFGITKDRFAAIATDTMRASLLTACGYQTQVMEFIDLEHTPKNLLIRAIRRKSGNSSAKSMTSNALRDVRTLRSQLQIPPLMLERRLDDLGLLASPEVSSKSEPMVADSSNQNEQDMNVAS